MLTRLAIGLLAVGVVAMAAPPAVATDVVKAGCSLEAGSPGPGTDTHSAHLATYAVVENGNGHLVCTLRVNSGTVASTDPTAASANGTGLLYAESTVTYVAPAGSRLELCTSITDGNGNLIYYDGCPDEQPSEVQIPPEVGGLLDEVDGLAGGARCGLAAAAPQHAAAAANTYTGVVYGYAAIPNRVGRLVCTVTVNGGVVASTNPEFAGAVGSDLLVTGGAVTFVAPLGSQTQVCADVTDRNGANTYHSCTTATEVAVPPQAVTDALNGVATDVGQQKADRIDPRVCAVLKTLAPGAGAVDVNAEGDTTVAGVAVWDCPQYANPSSGGSPLTADPVRLMTA